MSTDAIVGYRLSPRQRHLWGLVQEAVPSARDARALVRVTGRLDADALRDALHRLVERHDVLRTTFARLPGMAQALQTVGEARVRWEDAEDLRGVPEEAREARLRALWEGAGSGDERLPAARLIRVAEEEHLLFLRASPLSADAASFEPLVQDLAVLYAAAGGDAGLDEPVPYLAVSEWLGEVLASEEAEAGRSFWIAQCEGPEVRLLVEEEGPGPRA
ncbi:MAG TPA: condensation domain-containing protein, partial [Longimicrobiaceae bacterium]|nr:condensation domain-containing protein [Longimicrobiaceae bacterium]